VLAGLRDARRSLSRAGDTAWTVSSSKAASGRSGDAAWKAREVKKCAHDIHEKSHFISIGPVWLQRSLASALIVLTFDGKPYGIILGLFGLIDKVVISQCSTLLLGVIPSWIDDDIVAFERKVQSIESDVAKLKQSVDDFVQHIVGTFDRAVKVLDKVEEELSSARGTMQKMESLLGPAGMLLEEMIGSVGKAFDKLGVEIKLARSEIATVVEELSKELTHDVDKVRTVAKKLLDSLESIRPANIIQKLEDLADEGLYGGLIGKMAESRSKGESQLCTHNFAQPPTPTDQGHEETSARVCMEG